MKYIFIAGAPGSKWSSVAKNIYYSNSIDRTDASQDRQYFHDASGRTELMHMGAYWDPGMEFGTWFGDLDRGFGQRSREEHEKEFDQPFSGAGIRIIKSHYFCYLQNIEFLKKNWPNCSIVLVHRPTDACLGWWVKCGHFNISYPSYHGYYKNLREMSRIITRQNHELLSAWDNYSGPVVQDNHQLCSVLGIELPPAEYQQTYQANDIKVKVI